MNYLSFYKTAKINLNIAIDKIFGKDEKNYTKTANSLVEEQNNLYEVNSLQWDEYGNPYVYSGVC